MQAPKEQITAIERVQIWNTFFALIREQAGLLHQRESVTTLEVFDPRGMLPAEKARTLGTLLLCALAIEARANHLLEELEETDRIKPGLSRAVRHLPIKGKWFLLPTLSGHPERTPSDDSPPHQAIAQICELRNHLLHVDFQGLKSKLPKPGAAVSYFNNFVAAMEDMNVILDRIDAPRQEVLARGSFSDYSETTTS